MCVQRWRPLHKSIRICVYVCACVCMYVRVSEREQEVLGRGVGWGGMHVRVAIAWVGCVRARAVIHVCFLFYFLSGFIFYFSFFDTRACVMHVCRHVKRSHLQGRQVNFTR